MYCIVQVQVQVLYSSR